MANAHDIADAMYKSPAIDDGEHKDIQNRVYGDTEDQVLPFIIEHRTVLVSHVRRYYPHLFNGKDADKEAWRSLELMTREGYVQKIRFSDPGRHNIYMITDDGIHHARSMMTVIPESLPTRRRDPNGGHILHEILTTDVAVARHELIRSHPDFEPLWEERFGFHRIRGFEPIVPDYAQLYRSPNGVLIDFVEVSSGERPLCQHR